MKIWDSVYIFIFADHYGLWIICGIQLVWSFVAVAFNGISFIILTRQDMSNTCNRLLALLVFCNNLHILCTIVMLMFTLTDRFVLIRITNLARFHSTLVMCAAYITITSALERYSAISRWTRR